MTDDERQIRAARNESLFRALNERLESVREGTRPEEATEYFCECAQRSCASMVQLSPEQYEYARAEGDRFIVMPGHLTPHVERVAEQHETYWIVEKLGLGSYAADALNPRA